MSDKVLVVDDEKEIADLLEFYLCNEGFEVYKFYNGHDAIRCIEKENIDIAVLDIMLPDIDGFQICQKIREHYFFPIIMLPIIALSDKAVYQGKGKQYTKFVASEKRRNVQLPAFVYSIIFFLIFVGLSYTPLASSGKQYFYIFDVKLLVNQVNQNIIDGFYLCEDPSADKNGCYVKFSNASDLTDYPFIPIRSSLNGKKLQGYIKAVRKKEDYTYYVSITDGENGFQNKNVNNLTIQSLDKVNKIKLSKDAPLYKKS